MNNKEIATKCLLEAVELLNEASNHGQKRQTYINNTKDVELNTLQYQNGKNNKLINAMNNYSANKAEKILDKHDAKKLEKLGKDARKQQKKLSKVLDFVNKRTGEFDREDKDYQSALKGLTDTKPIKDKEKMRKNNIKLGYQIAKTAEEARAKANNESVELAALLAEAAELLNNRD